MRQDAERDSTGSDNPISRHWSGPVVVGIADAPVADQLAALRFAAAQANRRRADLWLVHGCLPLVTATATEPVAPTAELVRRAEERVSEAAAAIDDLLDAGRQIECEVTARTGVESLVELSHAASMLVLQRRDTTLARRLHTGSMTSRVCAQSAAPVAVLKSSTGLDQSRSGVAVGVDSRGHAALALEVAFTEADSTRQPLIAVHAWQLPGPVSAYGYVAPTADEVAVARGNARAELAEALAGYGERFPDVVVRRQLVRSEPTDALLDAASRAQLLVVGRHRELGVASFGLGSVARHCLQRAQCPVLVVPPRLPQPAHDPAGRWAAEVVVQPQF